MSKTAPDFSIESQYDANAPICGVDEAGRGPWAGPVVAAAVILPQDSSWHGLNDSKKLSATRRDALYEQIMAEADVGIGIAEVADIDQLNILGATKHTMQQAVAALSTPPAVALIDGNQPPQLPCQSVSVIKGDAKSLSIAAASIIAKVTRDRQMCALAMQFPQYGWEKNMGYGTKQHQEGLRAHGITAHHRRSFAPIRALLNEAA
ncbi:MAG: ribonuclease HII [Rickettsiales bacterium]|nr:ribonuclease HII [Rickettsiales bacterium]